MHKPEFLINAKPTVLLTYVTAVSTANYKPQQWDIITTFINKNELMNLHKNGLPWIKFSLELLSIGVYNINSLSKLFNYDFLHKLLMREYNTLDYLQLLLLYQGVCTLIHDYDGSVIDDYFINKAIEITFAKQECPLKIATEHIFGGEDYVHSKVKSKYGHFVDHVIVFNENHEAVKCKNDSLKNGANMEDIICGPNEQR